MSTSSRIPGIQFFIGDPVSYLATLKKIGFFVTKIPQQIGGCN